MSTTKKALEDYASYKTNLAWYWRETDTHVIFDQLTPEETVQSHQGPYPTRNSAHRAATAGIHKQIAHYMELLVKLQLEQ